MLQSAVASLFGVGEGAGCARFIENVYFIIVSVLQGVLFRKEVSAMSSLVLDGQCCARTLDFVKACFEGLESDNRK